MVNARIVSMAETVACLVERARRDDLPGLAAELAFRFFLALFPFFIVLAALGGLAAAALGVRNPAEAVLNLGGDALPGPVADLLRPPLEQVLDHWHGRLFSTGLVAALLSATSATNAVVKGLNRAYGAPEARARGHRYVVSLTLTVATGALLVASFALVLLGQFAARRLAAALGREGQLDLLLAAVRWPVVCLLLLLAAALVYRWGPSVQPPWRWATPGAALFAGGWLLATWGFSIYLARVATYNAVYGALAGAIVVLVWFYVVGFALVLGGELNALLDEAAAPDWLRRDRRRARADGRERAAKLMQMCSVVGPGLRRMAARGLRH
jgi:membrane protein